MSERREGRASRRVETVGQAMAERPDGERRDDCPCRKRSCPNFGSCAPCRAKHGAKGGKPYCER